MLRLAAHPGDALAAAQVRASPLAGWLSGRRIELGLVPLGVPAQRPQFGQPETSS